MIQDHHNEVLMDEFNQIIEQHKSKERVFDEKRNKKDLKTTNIEIQRALTDQSKDFDLFEEMNNN